MFICIEFDTADIVLWQQIDTKLANELGFTHVVWGVNKQKVEKVSVACKIPSNLYSADVSCTASELGDRLEAILQEYKTTYNFVVMGSEHWSHRDQEYKQPKSSVSDGGVDEIESRQE